MNLSQHTTAYLHFLNYIQPQPYFITFHSILNNIFHDCFNFFCCSFKFSEIGMNYTLTITNLNK